MSKIRLFQTLVGASLITYFLFFFFPLLYVPESPSVQKLLAYSGYGSLIPTGYPLVYFPLVALRVVAAIGLFFFLSWGRWVFVAHIAVGFAFMPFLGIGIYTPIDGMLSYLTAMIEGALLILCFTQPYSIYMRKDTGANSPFNPDASRRPST